MNPAGATLSGVEPSLLLASNQRGIRPGRNFSGRHGARHPGSRGHKGGDKGSGRHGGKHKGGHKGGHKHGGHHHGYRYSGIWISPYYWGWGWNSAPYWNAPWRYGYYDRPRRVTPPPAPRIPAPTVRSSPASTLPRGSLTSLPANARVLHTEQGTRYRWQGNCYRFDWQVKRYQPIGCPAQ